MNTTTSKSRRRLYAALDLHARRSVLGWMDVRGRMLGTTRFETTAAALGRHLDALPGGRVTLTLESCAMARWAANLARHHVEKVIVCDPRYNRLVSSNSLKNDRFDVEALCRLTRLDDLHPVWIGTDQERETFRSAVYDLLKLRDLARNAKVLIKSRLRGWGLPIPSGREVFGRAARQRWLEQLPSDDARAAIAPLYQLFDGAKASEAAARREVARLGAAFPELEALETIPGVGFVASHVFLAIVEDPWRFKNTRALHRFAALSITERTSDGRPLGYQRLERRGHRELKNLSYHAWRAACRSTTADNAVKDSYQLSVMRIGNVRHARLNTQRRILGAMLAIAKSGEPFDPVHFLTDSFVKATQAA